jgi:hypothetical protein
MTTITRIAVALGCLLVMGCGPSYLERLQAEERARFAAACQADPQGCLLYTSLAAQVAADEAAQPVVVAPQPQRVFIQPWPGTGAPAPLGYIDIR